MTARLQLSESIPSYRSYHDQTFTFLNRRKRFADQIDWNCAEFGKLWTYNLTYFDFVHEPGADVDTMVALMRQYCSFTPKRDGAEPYPISLRAINWIKFLSLYRISDASIDRELFIDCTVLKKNLEYHLLGNHLLENGFALLFAGMYFQDKRFFSQAAKILRTELSEQIHQDGAHFELSPMYHQIILFRILDAINLLKNNSGDHSGLLEFLEATARQMLAWLRAITFSNGEIPMVNDSAFAIAPSSQELFAYAKRLGLPVVAGRLSDSGYRKIANENFELLVDVGQIGPDYIPGHAHSDTLSYIFYLRGKPVIVDTGISTYENCQTRIIERSTESHNTVKLENYNQTEVWGSFRVGRRAKISALKEMDKTIECSHDGYAPMGVIHHRKWRWTEDEIIIDDTMQGADVRWCTAYVHFHPSVHPIQEDRVISMGGARITVEHGSNVALEFYNYASGFNQVEKAIMMVIKFQQKCSMRIQIM